MTELTNLSAQQLVKLIQKKEISCVEIMQAHLDRIAVVNPLINALVQQLSAEESLKQAHAADAAIAQGKDLGKLHGLPITIKDGRKVRGFLCSLGTKSPRNYMPNEDATVVARLRAAGAIILGLTNIPAFLVSAETDNLLYGRTNNPYDLSRVPGGSSGGQAALIAAGGISLGIGSDSGGSIRQPAHACGIAGLKPTQGLVPITGEFPMDGAGMIGSINVQGPLARFVEDLMLVLPIIAGPDERDPDVTPVTLRDPNKVDLKSLRVAFFTDNGLATANDDTTTTVKNAATALSAYVANVREDCPAVIKETYQTIMELFFYGGDQGHWLMDTIQYMQVSEPEPMVQDLLNKAKQCKFSVTELRNRFIVVDQFKFKMMDFMRDYDVIISPIATVPAGLHHKVDTFKEVTYTFPYNITGWPAAVVRCGTSKEGLPIGVQVIAKSYREDIVLAVAKRLEELCGGWKKSTIL